MDNLTENVKRGIRQKLRRGEYPDKAPIGYLNEPRLRTIVIDEANAPLVRRMFETYATGKFTLPQLQDIVTGWGVRTRFGNPITLSLFPKILANPFFIGQFRYAGELYDGSHTPLISHDLFDRVQDVLARRARGPYRKKQKPQFPLRGYFQCGECTASITAEFQKGHNYYRCTKRKGPCTLTYIWEETLTRQLAFKTATAGLGDWLEKWQRRVADLKRDDAQNADAILAERKVKLAAIQTRLDRLLDVFLDGHVSRDEYTARKEKMLLDKNRLAEEVAKLEERKGSRFELLEQVITQAKRAEDAAMSGNVEEMVGFHQFIGSNLCLFNATEEQERQRRAMLEGPERKSVNEGRRGGFGTRADTTPPEAAHEIRQNPSGNPSRLSVSRIGSPSRSASSPSSGRRPSPLRGRIRRGFPVLRVEWPGPWKIIAEKKANFKLVGGTGFEPVTSSV